MSLWIPWAFLLVAALLSAVAGIAARGNERADTGGFWATSISRCCLWLGLPVLLFTCIREIFAATRTFGFKDSWLWLGVLAILWGAILMVGLASKKDAASGRWLVGSLGFSPRRYWLLGFSAVLAIPIWYRFGGWSDAWNAVPWGVATLLACALAAAAVSLPGPASPATAAAARTAPTPPLPDWPEAMKAAGIPLEHLATLPPSTQVPPPSPSPWTAVLASRGADGVAPELVDALFRLVYGSDPAAARCRLILAPPLHGQVETLAQAASDLAQRMGEVTLVVTPGGASSLAQALARWVTPERAGIPAVQVADVDANTDLAAVDVWVVDADVLSDYLLGHLKQDSARVHAGTLPLLRRIGLVAWWDVDRYSGVKAANMWAISRRLNRLLAAEGRSGVRAVAFSQNFAHPNAQSTAFLAHLLPYPFDKHTEVRVPVRVARSASIWIARGGLTETAVASVQSSWPTAVDELGGGETEAVLRGQSAGGKSVESLLALEAAAAGARVIVLRSSELLSLPERVSAGGRAADPARPHHVALLIPANPYVDFVLAEFRKRQAFDSSPYLVGAGGHAGIVKRQAQQALREVADTMVGLRQGFLWEEDVLAATLRELSARGQLHRRLVRFLNSDRRLQRDHLYANMQPSPALRRPLQTVGAELVEVRDPSVAGPKGLLMEVDPERAALDAYPRRVFYRGGRRYRVREWTVVEGRRLLADPEDVDARTWRGRAFRLTQLASPSQEILTRGFKRYTVSVVYTEELLKIIERRPGAPMIPSTLGEPVKSSFATRALILEVPRGPDADTLHVTAVALRHVIPVHIGVEEDYLEVAPMRGNQLLNGRPVIGLALADLLPGGGVGLIEALQEDDALLQTILDRTAAWLSDCVRQGHDADKVFGLSPLAVATGGVTGLALQPALELLNSMRGLRSQG